MGNVINLFIIAVVFGFAGFLIETGSGLVKRHKLVYAGDKYFWGMPILPIYSAGGLIMHFSIRHFLPLPWYITLLFTWVILCAWEFLAGLYCDKVVGRKFWNYSKEKYNLHGYVGAENAGWWLFFIAIYFLFFFRRIGVYIG